MTRARAGVVTAALVAACCAAGCSTILGISDFGPAVDGGVGDVSQAEDTTMDTGSSSSGVEASLLDQGADTTASSSGSGSGSGSSSSSGSSSGTDASSSGKQGDAGDAGIVEPPSCAPGGPGMTDCGPGGSGNESCCTSLAVPGGTFYRTYVNNGNGPTATADPASISDFRLDKYLVTVGRYRQFVAAWNAGWRPTAGSGKHTHLNGGQGLSNSASPGTYESGWLDAYDANVGDGIGHADADLTCGNGMGMGGADSYATWTPAPGAHESLPINCVDWYDAYAFCVWDGGFLPSKAEAEYAAAGGFQEREYPWGSTAPSTATNQYAIYGCFYPGASDGCAMTGATNIAPVGTPVDGAGRWGHLDLTGDLRVEPVDCWLGSNPDPCTDCAYLPDGGDASACDAVLLGGDFTDPPGPLAAWGLGNGGDIARTDHFAGALGIRCARTP